VDERAQTPTTPKADDPGQGPDAYQRLLRVLDAGGARYRVIEHAPEGRTEVVSALRGNPVAAAAKCMVLMVKQGKKVTRYVLAVVPGDRRVDFDAIKRLYDASYVSFASSGEAERLAGSVAGTILPFSFDQTLELIADPAVLANPELFFNAARLDRSLALATGDYAALAKPRLEAIAERSESGRITDEWSHMEMDTGHDAEPGPALIGELDPTNPWGTFLDVKYGPLDRFDINELVEANQRPWYNQTLTRINDCVVRLGVVRGEFPWHRHEDEDEFFYVVEGTLEMDVEGDRVIELGERQGLTVPRGVMHRPRAEKRTVILMVEGAGVVPLGDPALADPTSSSTD
jgi:Ala-tRNA(Pro) deacylase